MHELGIVFHIIDRVDEVAEQNHVSRVKSVTLEIGEVSTIVPVYLRDCWSWAVDNRSKHMKGCELKIDMIKATSYCEDCQKAYPTKPSGRKCPYCGGPHTYLVSGDETTIKNIEVYDEENA
ncbi:MAG: hydrogenase maturation nickel metallochaperone HypA [Bacilli bacterium]|jgi:hydrogenase nickel incorporation protein HypA/HybF|nr:hydrogenase maturation nickel metallochaperone HypA [Bacilli bacterium]